MTNNTGGVNPRELRVRAVRPRDISKVKEFFRQNQTHPPITRDLAAIIDAHEPQGGYVVEDTRTTQIVAAGASCAHCDGRFVEIGEAVVRWKGYGLQRLLTQIRTVKSLAMTNEDVDLFCIVEPGKGNLKDRMRQLGFKDWTTPAQELINDLARQGHMGGDYMIFDSTCVEAHRQGLLAILRSPVLHHVGTGELSNIFLDTLLTSDPDFRAALETAAPMPTSRS
jgi:hypothetical protein